MHRRASSTIAFVVVLACHSAWSAHAAAAADDTDADATDDVAAASSATAMMLAAVVDEHVTLAMSCRRSHCKAHRNT